MNLLSVSQILAFPRTAGLIGGLVWAFMEAGLSALVAAELPPPTQRAVDFDQDILPIFEGNCYDCHDASKQKGHLRLDEVRGILKGGDSGEPLFLKGKSAESSLIKHVTSVNPKEMMPPKGDRITPEEIGLLRAWIDAGARMPGEAEAAESLKIKTDHWSFQPVKRPTVPDHTGYSHPSYRVQSGASGAFVKNEVDAFVLEKLKARGLAPSPPADRAALIRRLYLVMHGMPPAPAEVAAFIADPDPDAYDKLVDRVLASPRHGERWARHWMDVVRYADTNGFETNRPRPNAWHYRDWIINAFNEDKPYDQFIREQLAGDALGADAATGFLVAGTYDVVKGDPLLNATQRENELTDMVNTTATAFMGLTLGCARCHNHKFDPILQKDYFAMQAVFSGVNHGERPLRQNLDATAQKELDTAKATEAAKLAELEVFRQKASTRTAISDPTKVTLRPPVNAKLNEELFASVEAISVKFTILGSSSSQPCLDELEIYDESGQNVALSNSGAVATASSTLPGYEIHQVAHLNDGRTGNSRSWIARELPAWVRIDLPAKTRIQRIVWGRDRAGQFKDRVATHYLIEAAAEPDQWVRVASSDDRKPFTNKKDPKDNAFLTQLSKEDAAAARQVMADLEAARSQIAKHTINAWVGQFRQPGPTHRLYRGEPLQNREVVAPDALSVLGTLGMAVDEPEQQRRVKLANWIASPGHPLTARVMVNRLWHYIFGTGIVDTPGDFGKNGSPPSHPELLDWLADEFVQSGWSVKHIQRLLLLSATFQQQSAPNPQASREDADGRLLWRYTPRRLEAEAIRDSMLTVSGGMDLKMGGPGFSLMNIVTENVMHYYPKETYTPEDFRRMVYQFRIRQTTDSVFSSFDCPDGGQVMAKRSRSNTPLQALNLFNSSFVLQQADILTARLKKEAGDSPAAQVKLAFELCYARPPDAWELEHSTALIQELGLPALTRALYNSSEFLFIF